MSRLSDSQAEHARAQHTADHCDREVDRATKAQWAAVAAATQAHERLDETKAALEQARRESMAS